MKFYNSSEELMNDISETKFEIDNNIQIVSKTILPEISNDHIKVILAKKSNGEFGLVLGILISRNYNLWFTLYPYEEVIAQFPDIYKKYLEIDKINQKFWSKK